MPLALTLVRWVHFSASILLAGLFLFETIILIPASRMRPAVSDRLLERFRGRTYPAACLIFLLVFVSWFAWSWLVASAMTGDDLIQCLQRGDWWTVLKGTQFGHTWLFRVFISLLFGIILWWLARASKRRRFLRVTLTGFSAIELVSLAWVGHAAADSGPFRVAHLSGDALHLLTSGFWPGGLAPLAAFLFLVLKSSQNNAIELTAQVVRRFSRGSLIAVAILAASGLSNSLFMVGSFRSLLTTPYGQLLVSKVILFFVIVGFGAWNLFLLKPTIAFEIAAVNDSERKRATRLLLRNVLWELGLGTVVILIVGLLGITTPPMR